MPSSSSSSLNASPVAGNAQGIAASFEAPDWYLSRFAANIRVRSETVAALTDGASYRRVLDIGCGDGSLSLPLLPRAGHVTFLDPSAEMLARVGRRVRPQDAAAVDFVNSGFMEAGLPAAGFDLILCLGVLAYVPHLPSFMARLRATLQPGGTLILECTDHSHPLSRLERGYQSATALFKPRPFATYPHRARDVVAATEAQGLYRDRTFRYAYGVPVLSKFVSQPNTYKWIRRAFGAVGHSARPWLGNQCIFSFERL